jgi:hypothetical protein
MKQLFRTVLFLHLFIIILSVVSHAQKLTGIWRGYFITESGEEYRLEFQVQQLKTAAVTGVSYSYLDKRFYGKATMIGNFAVKNNSFQIQETVTTEVRNLEGNSTCLMNYKFAYAKSGNEEFLEGTYVGKSEDRLNPKNNGVWGDCGGGKVYLRRVEKFRVLCGAISSREAHPEKNSSTNCKNPGKESYSGKTTGCQISYRSKERYPGSKGNDKTAPKESWRSFQRKNHNYSNLTPAPNRPNHKSCHPKKNKSSVTNPFKTK